MQIRYHNIHETRSFVATVLGDQICLGRSTTCDVVLKSPFVCPEAAILKNNSGSWTLHVLNQNGCILGGMEISSGRTVTLDANSSFRLFPYEFSLDPEDSTEQTEDDIWNDLENRSLDLVRRIHVALLEQMNLAEVAADQVNEEYLLRIERNLEVIAKDSGFLDPENYDLVLHLAGHCVRGELIDGTLRHVDPARSSVFSDDAAWSRLYSKNPTLERELQRLQNSIAVTLSLVDEEQLTLRMKQLDAGFRPAWKQIASTVLDETLLYLGLRQLKKQIKDIVFGYGPLEDLLRLPTITEVMVVGSDRIFVERDGIIENSGRRFVSDNVTLAVIGGLYADDSGAIRLRSNEQLNFAIGSCREAQPDELPHSNRFRDRTRHFCAVHRGCLPFRPRHKM